MIPYKKFKLKNGLTVIVHEDKSTPLAAINILYDVGARDEHPERTGFAHLFEHLMFGGSVNIPDYDNALQKVGGTNNAFTNNDITNYYIKLPAINLETGFWLESDRMLSLAFSEKSLRVQKNVVCEEFKERYLNQPYGDVWLKLRPLAYQVHPYQWPTIGKQLSHIREAQMKDVKAFFNKHYCPSNAILVVAGNVTLSQVKQLSKKWFEPIPGGKKPKRKLPQEPKQKEARYKTLKRDVPANAIYKSYHTCSRNDKEYFAIDLLSDVLGGGDSGRLKQELVKKNQIFSSMNVYQSGSYDKGMFLVTGKLHKGVKYKDADKALDEELIKIKEELVADQELQKVKNQIESTIEFEEVGLLNRAMALAFGELQGDASICNKDLDNYLKVTKSQIKEQANLIFDEKNCSTLYYLTK
ncbi:insulinase family protein [Sphingobacteriaceae bacterium AH-315-L07]|nr:insulinase family protein [Bacteroidia bacterium]MBN4052363.1 insulinase family protein [Sphingobacteriaceae bacterium AH-315-L07]